jgi:hypothetical protein
MKRLPVIDLSGQPADIGFSHGKARCDQLKENYSIYLNMISTNTGQNESAIIDLARRFLPKVEKTAPELVTEMEGIAQGAGVSLETILVLNCRSELAFPDQLATQCTVVGLTANRTVSGHGVIAQNLDIIRYHYKATILRALLIDFPIPTRKKGEKISPFFNLAIKNRLILESYFIPVHPEPPVVHFYASSRMGCSDSECCKALT